ncbi:MAG: winged helix-turn-helix domain-containing protein [Bacteroidia bacterium]
MSLLQRMKRSGLVGLLLLALNMVHGDTRDQHTKVLLRSVGDEFLLQLGDSTSRVLPISLEEGRYAVRFERKFSFEPDLLLFCIKKTSETKDWSEQFVVEIESCDSGEVVHSFMAIDTGTLACKERPLPVDCYSFYFTPVVSDTVPAVEHSTTSWWMYIIGVLLVVVFLVLYFVKRKKKADLLRIGKYQFDRKGMVLLLKAETLELSSLESDLLFLLLSNENKTLEREHILNAVWGDEGNYVGRTLDVFISKLRKKLNSDPNIKIVNVRGVGYRLVVNS